MPEQTPGCHDIDKCLDFLEDYSLTTYQSRCVNYQMIQSSFYGQLQISEAVARRLLAVCIHDLKEDMKYASITLTIIAQVLKKVKSKQCPMVPELVPSALAVLHIIKTTALISKVQTLQTLSLETFLAYPDETYIALSTNHCLEVIEVFNLYLHQGIPVLLRVMAFQTLQLILVSLPSEKRTAFVKEGLNVWFSKVIPSTITLLTQSQNTDVSITLDVLEMLTAELEHIDFSDNSQWLVIMDCIYSPQKYPAVMKSLLEAGDEKWHRLWILFVKLLKHQITMIKPKVGSPINSMLPVVEAAFKVDLANRCHAFKCWSVLVDNFSEESNENFIIKRIKLLTIPLLSNNAKVDVLALAKFNTWWYFIRKFESRLYRYIDMIFMPFLQFCFGKPSQSSLIPGQLSKKLKTLAVQAFAESIGHIDCNGCIPEDFPKLTQGILNPNLLQDSSTQWIQAFKVVLKTCGSNEYSCETGMTQMSCIWKSILSYVSRLQRNAKLDVLGKFLAMLAKLVEECPDKGVLDLVFDVMLKAVLEIPQSRQMLDTVKESQASFTGLTSQILALITKPCLAGYYSSMEAGSAVSKLTSFTNALLDDALGPPEASLDLLLKEMPAKNTGLLLWTALAQSVQEIHSDITPAGLNNTILWPLQNMEHFENMNHAALVWNKMYNLLRSKLQDTTNQNDMVTVLTKGQTPPSDFTLFALLHVIKNNYDRECKSNPKLDLLALENVLASQKFVNSGSIEEVFRLTVDSSTLMLSSLKEKLDTTETVFALNLANMCLEILVHNENVYRNNIPHAEKLLIKLEKLVKTTENAQLRAITIEQLLVTYSALEDQTAKKVIAKIMRIFLSKSTEKESSLYKKVEGTLGNLKTDNTPNAKQKFPAPVTSAKKKKKEPSIVNTVVENGEEYVVVKSNWKFNPRKLTENQKEKFQKKREDIPALYQDLSQSQDEFKLRSWKTDSQDTSATSSNTTTSTSKTGNNEAAVTLQKMPSTEIVPKIMENIFSDKIPSGTKDPAVNENINSSTKSPKPIKVSSLSVLKLKSPRIALKDRVFQNVKNLIEKSSVTSQIKCAPEDLNQTVTEMGPKTPVSKAPPVSSAAYSAPPKISSERPARVKRKPRKFETDFTDLSLKRRRNSVTMNDSQRDSVRLGIDQEGPSAEVEDIVNLDKESKIQDKVPENEEKELPVKSIEPEKAVNITQDPDATHCDFIVLEDSNDKHTHCEPTEPLNCDLVTPVEKNVFPVVNRETKEDSPKNTKDSVSATEAEAPLSQDIDASLEMVPRKVKEVVKPLAKKPRKSRIEKELAIDMVEGHPLFRPQPEKRTRKSLIGVVSTRRKALSEKMNKLPQSDSKLEIKSQNKQGGQKSKDNLVVKDLFSAKDSQENCSFSSNEFPETMSEDFIESSQDSTMTTISTKSAKKNPKVVIDLLPSLVKGGKKVTQNTSHISTDVLETTPEKADIEFSRNKSMEQLTSNDIVEDLTADFDTEPMDDKSLPSSDDVIIINEYPEPVIIRTEEVSPSTQSQATADADTQPNDSTYLSEMNKRAQLLQPVDSTQNSDCIVVLDNSLTPVDAKEAVEMPTSTTQDVIEDQSESGLSSPFKDDEQRNKDFLNNTLEISPIKSLSPIETDRSSPSPETSSDFVVVTLSSPVQSDGEPFEKTGSPEIFTEDKISPDKRDLSPPRKEISVNANSPTSSLSLKKNKPQRRQGGRAAQMLGLCVPERQNVMATAQEKPAEPEEPKKSLPASARRNQRILFASNAEENDDVAKSKKTPPTATEMLNICAADRQNSTNTTTETPSEPDEAKKAVLTPARRNLRILYNCEGTESNNSDENENSENFLKFKKTLPTPDCSPAGPILKRKLIDIADEVTASPASKRKRVSFHDPPVSTTISVHKYIEPIGGRSPQGSLAKKQERQQRTASMKSPKKLENIFKLDTALTKTVDSFVDSNVTTESEDITVSSLDQTPSIEIVKANELNDTDPICPELVECTDAISLIAAELSSPAMKSLLIKELEGNIQTIGDLAKLSELEVNRLCIKAPKVKIAKKALSDYAAKIAEQLQITETIETEMQCEMCDVPSATEVVIPGVDMEAQTEAVSLIEIEIQTDALPVATAQTQTRTTKTSSCEVQTEETGSTSSKTIVQECLKEKPDFLQELANQLDEASKRRIIDDLPLAVIGDIVSQKITQPADSAAVMDKVLNNQKIVDKSGQKSSFLQEYLLQRYETNDLILLCSQLLRRVHDKTT